MKLLSFFEKSNEDDQFTYYEIKLNHTAYMPGIGEYSVIAISSDQNNFYYSNKFGGCSISKEKLISSIIYETKQVY